MDNESPTNESTDLPTEVQSNASDVMSQEDAEAAIFAISGVPLEEATPEAEEEVEDQADESTEDEELVDLDEDEGDLDETDEPNQDEEETDSEVSEYDFNDLDLNDKITINGVTKTRSQWDALAGQEKAVGTKARKAAEAEKAAEAKLQEAEQMRVAAAEKLKTAGSASIVNELAIAIKRTQQDISVAEDNSDAYEVVMGERKLRKLVSQYKQEQGKIERIREEDNQRTHAAAVKGIESRGLDFLVREGSAESKAWLNHAGKDLGLSEADIEKVAMIPGVAEAIWNSSKMNKSKKTTAKKVKSTKTGLPASGKKVMSKSQKETTARQNRANNGIMSEADIDAEILRITSGGR